MKRLSLTLLTILVAALTAAPAFAERGKIDFRVENQAPMLSTNEKGETLVEMPQTGRAAVPGQPALPYKVVRLAIPPEAIASSVSVKVVPRDMTGLPGEFDVAPAPPIRAKNGSAVAWGPNAARIVDGRDTGVYESEGKFPGDWGAVSTTISALRRYRFVTITVHPVRFEPSKAALFYAKRLDIEVTYKIDESRNDGLHDDCAQESLAKRLLGNFDETTAWYSTHCLSRSEEPGGIAVIMTRAVQEESELLTEYLDMRSQQGHDIDVYTESDWDIPTGGVFDDRADRIRRWLQSNYESLGLSYVFLVGNPDPDGDFLYGIPMKKCVTMTDPSAGEMTSKSDFYFAELTGNWDSDGDGNMCQWGKDEMEFAPELYVGRLPVYSEGAAGLDDLLGEIMDYEKDSSSGDIGWRRRVMLPSAVYWFEGQEDPPLRWDGASVAEWVIRAELNPRGMLWTTLYEEQGHNPSIFHSDFPLKSANVVDQWVRGYGLVFLMGHGSSQAVYRTVWNQDFNDNDLANGAEAYQTEFFSTGMLHMLSESPRAFVIHDACSNGEPYDANNVGYSLLRGGAIATISASDLSWAWTFPNQSTETWNKPAVIDGCSSAMAADYASNIFEGMEAGAALGTTIAETTDGNMNYSWYQKTLLNLYGDPLMRLVMCREDADCAGDSDCWKPARCADGTCFPGDPVVCDATPECETMVCEEGLGCVPSQACVSAYDAGVADAGADSGPTPTIDFENMSSKSSCSFAPQNNDGTSLMAAMLSLLDR